MSYIILAKCRRDESICGSFKTETKAECNCVKQELLCRGYFVHIIPPPPVELPHFITRRNKLFSFLF